MSALGKNELPERRRHLCRRVQGGSAEGEALAISIPCSDFHGVLTAWPLLGHDRRFWLMRSMGCFVLVLELVGLESHLTSYDVLCEVQHVLRDFDVLVEVFFLRETAVDISAVLLQRDRPRIAARWRHVAGATLETKTFSIRSTA